MLLNQYSVYGKCLIGQCGCSYTGTSNHRQELSVRSESAGVGCRMVCASPFFAHAFGAATLLLVRQPLMVDRDSLFPFASEGGAPKSWGLPLFFELLVLTFAIAY